MGGSPEGLWSYLLLKAGSATGQTGLLRDLQQVAYRMLGNRTDAEMVISNLSLCILKVSAFSFGFKLGVSV